MLCTVVQILEICLRLGVKCVTVFAFSIENFKRSEEEVDALMELAESKLLELSEHGYVLSDPVFFFCYRRVRGFSEMLNQYGVRLNVLGKIEMLPENVQRSVRIAQEMTKNNDKYVALDPPPLLVLMGNFLGRSILNLCMPYTSRDEIATAVQSAVQEKVVGGLDDTEHPYVPSCPSLISHV